MSFKSAVITFPGSNCDRDALCYLKDLTKGEVHNIWHEETSLPKVDLVILPGGFSFGDYLRSCLLYTSPSPRDQEASRMPSSA